MFGGDKRNLIIAIGVIFVILVGWQFLMPALFPSDERPRRVAEQREPGDGTAVAGSGRAGDDDRRGRSRPSPVAPSGYRQPAHHDRVTQAQRLHRAARRAHRFRHAPRLSRDRGRGEPEHRAVPAPRRGAALFRRFRAGLPRPGASRFPSPTRSGTPIAPPFRPASRSRSTGDNGAGLSFTRKIAVDDDFVFTVTQSVRNTTAAPIALAP